MIEVVAFSLLGGLVCAAATGTVRSSNLVHSVFWLGLTLVLTAGLFLALDAAFLAGIQIILYTGGIITLMLFGIMLTQRDPGTVVPNPTSNRLPSRSPFGAWTATLLFAALVAGIWSDPTLSSLSPEPVGDASLIGERFLTTNLIAFEALSILLLAAMIGAIVLARRTDP